MANNTPKQNALNERKLSLFAPPHELAEIKFDKPVQPTLEVKVVNNQPRLIVRTGVANDANYGKIEAHFDSMTFFSLIKALDEVIKDVATNYTVECKEHKWTQQGRSKEPMVNSRVTVGRDREGYVFIQVTDWDKARPRIKFRFDATAYHPWLGADGQPIPPNVVSNWYADAWRNLMLTLVPNILATEFISWQEQKEKREAGKGGGGNNNRQSGGYGGGNNRQAPPAVDIDDDIPF